MSISHLKNYLGGIAILVFMMSSAPGSAYSVPASSLATFTQISLYPNIETVGVTVSGSNLPSVAELLFRSSGESTWHTGHPLMRIEDGRLVGSLFELAPAT